MAKHHVTSGDLQQAGSPEKFYERIMFPIFDVLGNVIAFTGRALGEAQPKYLNSPESPLYNKSRVLYGLNFARTGIKEKNYIVLVEGQMDVIALHQHGITQAVASSGTAVTEAQLLILSKYADNFLLAFDNDAAGLTVTKKVIELLLRNDLNAKVMDFGQFKDAGELFEQKPAAWAAQVKAAREAVEWYLVKEVERIGEPQFVENKKALVKALLPILTLVSEPTRLDYYIQRVARQLEIKPESLYASLRKFQTQSSIPRFEPSEGGGTRPDKILLNLTNEEQLLTIFLQEPSLLGQYRTQLEEVNWSSIDAERIAKALLNCYNDKTLVKNQAQFLSQVKTGLNSQLDEKIDSWLFWLSANWDNFTSELASELAAEKIGQLSTKSYEQQKEKLAASIRSAQESGDLDQVKALMKELSDLTKEGKKSDD
jgi:DNA primase